MNTAKENEMYDAIVVGSGISGGWAAKELCENGNENARFGTWTHGQAYRRLPNDV